MGKRKILVVDTSVLLYDMHAIHSFPGNDIILPLAVLDELDRFKDRPGLLGESARYVNRYLDNLRKIGRLDQEVSIPESDQTVRVDISKIYDHQIHDGLDPNLTDNIILTIALKISRDNPKKIVKLITKDINLRVKCDALGLISEDYWKDYIDISDDRKINSTLEISLPNSDVDTFFAEGELMLASTLDFHENQLVVGKGCTGGSFLGRYFDNKIVKIGAPDVHCDVGLEPKNKEQKFAIDLLANKNIELVAITGIAGSGKTYIALMMGLLWYLEWSLR